MQERVLDEIFLHTLSEVDAAVVLVNPLRRTAFATGHAPELCGSVVFVSSGWQQLTGFRAEDVIGRNDCNFAAHGFAAQGPRTEPAVLTAIAEAMADRRRPCVQGAAAELRGGRAAVLEHADQAPALRRRLRRRLV